MLFNGCAPTQPKNTVYVDREKHVPPVPAYEVPPKRKCDKSMTLKECFIFQYGIAKDVRYTLIKQVRAVKAHNKRFASVELEE